MAPTIHLVRHAQGYHNLSVENEVIRDPDLTELGLQQCKELREAFIHHDKLTRLVASPLRRTVYTAIHAFGEDKLYPITALDLLQEVSTSPCDTGSAKEKLDEEFGNKLEVRGVDPAWTDKTADSKFEPTLEKLTARALEVRRVLRDLAGDGDDHIVATSHGGFLHFLTDDWFGIPSGHATGWNNCEYRSYQFVDPTGKDEDAALQETPESWRRRQGLRVAPTRTEQKEMRAAVQKSVAPYLHISA
ncbi:histidine phosphatase superfamily [Emericellopsis atlantica]|uniref:Histidine phosphatase superfamily n=1 Tax=Emericellopsis atlantica TaxID=2614577 RepID=A0A9P8CKV7_9HYPO|nr:histidine phosphatase superfamily [Emericellopsis atlantica]KAG9250437.1 histidine phosphatase superfamily [Emericellopsis atlantica]